MNKIRQYIEAASGNTMKYFYDDPVTGEAVELTGYARPMANKVYERAFKSRFPNMKAKKFDGISIMVMTDPKTTMLMPVTRAIEFKKNPSLHKCDARCQNAKGSKCECSCLGKNHGSGHG